MADAPEPASQPVVVPPEALARIAAALEQTSALRESEVKARSSLVHGESRGRDLVAVILASGVSIAVIAFVIGAELNVIIHGNTLSENTTQVLIALFSGVVGGLAGYLGGRAESSTRTESVNGTGTTTTTEKPR